MQTGNRFMSPFSKKENITSIAILALIYSFLLSYFIPEHLFSRTITTGGDTPSHYMTAHYLLHTLLPKHRIIGWMQGNYAGFPLFQFYFPMPFLIIAGLNLFFPLQVAFKLVTVLGIFLLPVSTFACLKLLGYPFPVPINGAIFSLPFLFMEANSMWGGNIPSTLAGEFAYSIGFALLILYAGLFYAGITSERYGLLNSILLAVIGLSHGYTLLFAVLMTTLFLFTTYTPLRRLWYYLKVNTLAFLLIGFWIIQLIWFMPYTTRYNFVWVLDGICQVFPGILYPAIALAVAGSICALICRLRGKDKSRICFDYRLAYLWFVVFLGGVLYFIGYGLNLVDIRFLPFVQFFLMILGAVGLYHITHRLKGEWIIPILLGALAVVWVNKHISYIPKWIDWDYGGFETKRAWPQFRAINDYLKGSVGDPRVVYEHSLKNRAFGSVRAFEMLPFFSGRSTLEGLYIQSTITSPFVFYLQSEISLKPSCPLQDYNYSRLNIKRGLEHLKLFNVSQFIVVTDHVKKALAESSAAVKEKEFPPYAIYRLRENPDRYVSLLDYEPILLITKDWRNAAFQWFRNSDLKTHIVFKDSLDEEDIRHFRLIAKDKLPKVLPRLSLPGGAPIKETMRPEEILIETPNIGRPHMIRVSYHPNWKAEGADRIYLISPSFMLIYPTRKIVRLYFGRSFPDYLGLVLTLIGLCIFLFSLFRFQTYFLTTSRMIGETIMRRCGVQSAVHRLFAFVRQVRDCSYNLRIDKRLLQGIGIFITGWIVLIGLLLHQDDATIIYNKGLYYFNEGDYKKAREVFAHGMKTFPLSPIIDQTVFHFGLTYFKEGDWEGAINAFEQMLIEYPETRKFTEVMYHVGICNIKLARTDKARAIFEKIVREFPNDRWAGYARERLKELKLHNVHKR